MNELVAEWIPEIRVDIYRRVNKWPMGEKFQLDCNIKKIYIWIALLVSACKDRGYMSTA